MVFDKLLRIKTATLKNDVLTAPCHHSQMQVKHIMWVPYTCLLSVHVKDSVKYWIIFLNRYHWTWYLPYPKSVVIWASYNLQKKTRCIKLLLNVFFFIGTRGINIMHHQSNASYSPTYCARSSWVSGNLQYYIPIFLQSFLSLCFK